MNQSLWVAKTGLDAQQTRMTVVANNLANVNTNGFKKGRAVFEDLIYQTIRQPGAQATQEAQLPSGLTLGMGVRTVATEKLFGQGGFVQTENSLDMAIEGRGFFQILMPNGDMGYTRDGTFQLNADGEIVMSNGYALQPGLTVPANALSVAIGKDGTVSAQLPGEAAPQELGNIQLADFVNPAGLQAVGENLYLESGASGAAQISAPGENGVGTVMQGALETSNVNMAEELVNMIETQRAYEVNSKAVSAADQMLQFVNNNLAR
ncbi:flagellar basal-body rod protein FlgG [Thiocystis violascens]|uniref:Flagellar basal-body rod protein FlgG n=1 Tax=Thiocystis violascens (strain ATCC 17096 / DSM 198 / 6111) TaxID=765911 RepID=I3Y651_THIV6|nr:flagellar basal-body rod protein FlgG [Thiocystis violascens]AFL72469.1 flagellar basal-body rod protein FlgG [Thiocystis violascens DSM 198]